MSKKNVPTKELNHLYESVGLYDAFYNRSMGFKMNEAKAFATVLESLEQRPRSILELFANTGSRHKLFFEMQYNYISEIERYKGLDGIAPESESVIRADAGRDDFPESFDAIFAYFFSMSSIVDLTSDTGHVTKEYTMSVLRNVRKHLNENGVFLIDSAIDGYTVSIDTVCDDPDKTIETIPLGHALRDELKEENIVIPDKAVVRAVNHSVSKYDRMSANVEDHISRINIYVDKELVFRYHVKLPFCQRYFSEPEILDMLTEAGFSKVDFWSADYENMFIKKLKPRVVAQSANESDSLMPNIYVGYA